MSLKTDPVDKVARLLEDEVPALLGDRAVEGASIALIRAGRCAWAGGFGVKNAETGDPIQTDTVFEAYSCTKPLVAYRAMHLCADGLLDLDRPLDDYLPTPYVTADPRGGEITLRMALAHTSGLPDDPDGTETDALLFAPGTRWSYSTSGFYYIARVIEQTTGQPLGQHMQQHLLDPLRMNASSFVWQDHLLPHMAQGHDAHGKPEAIRRIPTADADSLLTTPTDYARFIAHIIRPDEHFGIDATDMAQGHVAIGERLSWGLGWGVQHTDAGDCFWQFGGGAGAPFQNLALAFKESGTGVVLMTNSANGESVFEDLVTLALGGTYPIFPWSRFIETHFAGK